MPVSPFSRYAGLAVVQVQDARGRTTTALALRRQIGPPAPGGLVHQVVGSEQPDWIARRYYQREDLWWQIMDANAMRFPLDLSAGERLLVPAPRSAAPQLSREQRTR
jgi:hypothetical protein